MTDDELARLRELCDAATPGPWEDGTAMCCPDMGWVDGPNGKGVVCPTYEASKRTHTLDANDAAFIAAARTALPALLDLIAQLRSQTRSVTPNPTPSDNTP